jgi:two-component system, sensor histidine kinase and response regulator
MTIPKKCTVKFLLVDDLPDNLVALAALLARDDLELLQARSGNEALELLLAHDVALALLDVHMPGMDGFTLAEMMRASPRTRHIPIIFVTANPQEQHRVFRGYDAGAVDFLIKPLEPGILRHKTETFFQLYKQKQELAETLRLNEMFVAAIGHDLRSPLNSIVLSSELILRSTTDPNVRKLVEGLRSSGRRMARMIDELFDLARVRLGEGFALTRQRVDARRIAESVVTEHRAINPERTVLLEGDSRAEGEWDGTRLEQLVSNLVGNALTHGDPGEPVTVKLHVDGANLEITVHNAGAIPAETLPHIFAPFVSRRANRKRTEGLGLGLYIVDQIVQGHGGTVDVRSTAEEGTTFRVRLPVSPG